MEREEQVLPSACGVPPVELEDCKEVVLYCRVSNRSQDLDAQIEAAKAICRIMGIKIAYTFAEVASGKNLKRKQFRRAIRAAKKRGIPLLAITFSRLLRSEDYHQSQNPEARPSRKEIHKLLKVADGVPLLTLNNLDATPAQDEEFTKRSIAAARKTEKKEALKLRRKEIRRMRREGKTVEEIAHVFSASIRTVNRIIKADKAER